MYKYSIILLLIFTSCVTQKKCINKFPIQSNNTTIIESKDSIILKDTLIIINLPEKVIIDSIKIPCDEVPIYYIPDTVKVKTDFAEAKAWFSNKHIKIKLIQLDTILNIRLENAIKESYYWKNKYEHEVLVTKPIKYIPKIYKFSLTLWIGVIIAVGAYLGFKLFKKI